MIDERRTAIITYIDENYAENLEQDFLESLFLRAKYKGEVVVLNYGMDNESVARITSRFDVSIVRCEKIMPVFSNRYIDIPHAIDSLDDNITQIMLMDGGDIWFQDDISAIFNETKNGIGCVEEDRVIGEDDFTDYCMNKMSDSERTRLEGVLLGKKVKNSGVICGPRDMVKKIVCDVAKDMRKHETEFFGIDQLYFDYEWYLLNEDNRVELSDSCNYVLVSNKDKYVVVDGDIYDAAKGLVKVVHNAGANWRMLNRPFKNVHSNEKQYIDVRTLKD